MPRKPHPFGNEYHTICCGLSGILFSLELVEGKDRPKEYGKDPSNRFGKTCGLLLRLCKTLFNTGKIVVLDSGFCVLKGLVELKKRGVFAHAVIKKRKYWPKYIEGDAIDKEMATKDVGSVGVLSGKLDNVDFTIFSMKEPAFNMKMMSTYGDVDVPPNQEKTGRFYKDESGKIVHREFEYTTVFSNHFKYRHTVDDHNNLRHSTPSLEETWITHRWPNRVFSFILAVCEVNAFLAYKYFILKEQDSGTKALSLHQFRRKLAMSLIYNDMIDDKKKGTRLKKRKRSNDHDLLTAPPYAKKFSRGKWDKSSKFKYQQFTCKTPGCTTRIRTFCKCARAHWMCHSCYTNHIIDEATPDDSDC